MISSTLGLLLFLASSGQSLRYWIEPCQQLVSGCQPEDVELADWAFQAWQHASGKSLQLSRVEDLRKAHIRVYWAGAREGVYGEARPIMVEGKQGAEVYVRPAAAMSDRLLRETVVYLTCLHETGHALGLAHTANFADIMYNFQFGGDIAEYFGRYRRKLNKHQDIQEQSGMSDGDRKRLLAILTGNYLMSGN